MIIHEAMTEVQASGQKVNQKNLTLCLKGVLGRDKLALFLQRGEGSLWNATRGERKEFLYQPKTLKPDHIYNQDFRVLENEDEIEIPEIVK